MASFRPSSFFLMKHGSEHECHYSQSEHNLKTALSNGILPLQVRNIFESILHEPDEKDKTQNEVLNGVIRAWP